MGAEEPDGNTPRPDRISAADRAGQIDAVRGHGRTPAGLRPSGGGRETGAVIVEHRGGDGGVQGR